MTKIRTALFLAVFSVASIATLREAAAQSAVNNDAYVMLRASGLPGTLAFNYGWASTRLMAAQPVGYWLGVYDVTNSHYVWASENVLPTAPVSNPLPSPGTLDWTSIRVQYLDTAANLPPGQYKINFFVRSNYATNPLTNVAEIELPFTVY